MAKYLVAALFALAALLIYANAKAQLAPAGVCGPTSAVDGDLMRNLANQPIRKFTVEIPISPGETHYFTFYVDQKNGVTITVTQDNATCLFAVGSWNELDKSL